MFNKKLSLVVLPLVAVFSLHASDPMNDPFFQDPFGDDIFKEMMKMHQNMDKMFEKMQNRMQQRSSGLINPLGTYKIANQGQFEDKGSQYEFVTNIPENKENHIEVNAKDGVLSITAKIIEKQENKSANSFSSSSSMRMYQQSMPLPNDADEGSVKAKYIKGKLVITLDKKKPTQTLLQGKKTDASKSTTEKHEKKDLKNKEEKNKEVNASSVKKMTINSDIPSMS